MHLHYDAETEVFRSELCAWLEANQRQSGRWWTQSLNTDNFHFITYTGTLYPVMALAVTGSVPSLSSERR